MTQAQSTQEQIILAGAQALAFRKNVAALKWTGDKAPAAFNFALNRATKLAHNEKCGKSLRDKILHSEGNDWF